MAHVELFRPNFHRMGSASVPTDTEGLAPYLALKEKALRGRESGHYFICEGRLIVSEAIKAAQQGHLRVISLLCDDRQAEEWADILPPPARLFAVEAGLLDSIVGFHFHRGVLCCCAVPKAPDVAEIIPCSRLLVLPRLENVDNLGQLLRSAAALGMDAVLMGSGPNPFVRRCVRVSMGAAWKLPVLKCDAPENVLQEWLRCPPGTGAEIAGTAQRPDATPFHEWSPLPRTALVLGTEADGLDESWQARCTRHVRIPLARGIDSLNVSAAGAMLMGKMSQ